MSGGMIPSEDAAKRLGAAVQWVERQYRNPGLRQERVVRNRGGGGCADRNEVWQITILGSPTGGSFDISINVLGTTDTLTFDFDFTAAEVETELETHTNIASGDVDVTGGDFPDTTINIEFTGDLASHRIPIPTISFASLTGGTGVGVILARYQPGHPTDGSVAP